MLNKKSASNFLLDKIYLNVAIQKNDNLIFKPNKKKLIKRSLSKKDLCEYSLIGQFDAKFLILVNRINKNILVLDQHAIHERILYESFSIQFQASLIKIKDISFTSQITTNQTNSTTYDFMHKRIFCNFKLRQPLRLEKYKINIHFNFSNLPEGVYNFLHFEFEVLDDHIEIYSVPVILDRVLEQNESIELFLSLFEKFHELFSLDGSALRVVNLNLLMDVYSYYIKSKACRDAIMFNDILEERLMNELLNQLKQCMNPFICAHGRFAFYIILKES